MKYLAWLICVASLSFSCKTPSKQTNNSQHDQNKGDSTQYANVFQPWDGHWKGKFIVLYQAEGQLATEVKPRIKSLQDLQKLRLDTSMVIDVEQHYRSTSPYYQTVNITDSYLEGGEVRTVQSEGYNAVKGDSLICLVRKPDETVVHQGEDLGEGIIVWARDIPGKAEYFYEEANDSAYTIIGWGYYGSDQTDLAPKTYFYGRYRKQNQ